MTIHDNKRGWNAADANKGGYIASYIRKSLRPSGQRLSGKWIEEAKTLMRKYAGQLARIAEENMAKAA